MTRIFVTEPTPIPDVFATGILPLETINGCCRVTYTVDKTDALPDSHVLERVIVARIILPEEVLLDIMHVAQDSYEPLKPTTIMLG